jgi:hypothetical protein
LWVPRISCCTTRMPDVKCMHHEQSRPNRILKKAPNYGGVRRSRGFGSHSLEGKEQGFSVLWAAYENRTCRCNRRQIPHFIDAKGLSSLTFVASLPYTLLPPPLCLIHLLHPNHPSQHLLLLEIRVPVSAHEIVHVYCPPNQQSRLLLPVKTTFPSSWK